MMTFSDRFSFHHAITFCQWDIHKLDEVSFMEEVQQSQLGDWVFSFIFSVKYVVSREDAACVLLWIKSI